MPKLEGDALQIAIRSHFGSSARYIEPFGLVRMASCAFTSGCQQTYERLLDDDCSKDVTIETSDAPIEGHSCAASDAFRGLLRNGTAAEADHKHLSWRLFPSDVCTFFLELLYLGESMPLAERNLFLALADAPAQDKRQIYQVSF